MALKAGSFGKVQSDLPVRYSFTLPDGTPMENTEVYAGVTRDVSEVGVVIDGPFIGIEHLKDLLNLKLFMGINVLLNPSETPFRCRAKLVWVEASQKNPHHFRLGCVFQNLVKDERDRMRNFRQQTKIYKKITLRNHA